MVSTRCDVRTKYNNKKSEICNIVEELNGDFIGDFVISSNPASQEKSQIADLAHIQSDDVDKYVYIVEFNGKTLIKK